MIAEANRAPVAVPKTVKTNRDAMRLVLALRRSELRYMRGLKTSVATYQGVRRAYRKATK